MIARSHSAASRPCRHPPNLSPTKAVTAGNCLKGARPGPSSRHEKTRKIRYHYDRAVYGERNIIERMFCRLKDRRRIATRFERNIKNVMAVIARAAALISWL